MKVCHSRSKLLLRRTLFAASVLVGTILVAGSVVAAEKGAKPELGSPDFYPSPQHPVGYRGDWTGRYPGATPAFIADRYILWKTYVGSGESSPIIVGNGVFTLGDSVRISCLNKDDSPNTHGYYLIATPAEGKDYRVSLRADYFWGRGATSFVFEGNRMYALAAKHGNSDPRGQGWLCCSGDPLTFPLRPKGWKPPMFSDAKAADVPKLMTAAKSGKVATRRLAIDALCRLGPEAKSAVPLLGELLDDPDDSIALAAVRALHAMAADATSLVPELTKRIEGADRDKQRLALLALRALGPHGKGAWHPTIRHLGINPGAVLPKGLWKDFDIRFLAVDALRAAGTNALPDLADIVSKDAEARGGYWGWDMCGRSEALGLIRELGPAAKEAVPALVRCMKERRFFDAANTLLAVDPDTLLTKDCFDFLTAAAGDPKRQDRIYAIRIIGRLGPKAAAAAAIIEEATKDKKADLAKAAKEALEQIRR